MFIVNINNITICRNRSTEMDKIILSYVYTWLKKVMPPPLKLLVNQTYLMTHISAPEGIAHTQGRRFTPIYIHCTLIVTRPVPEL